jgi:hypothetical protein
VTTPVRWRLLLPADWWQVPLEDRTRRVASVEALVAQAFQGVDDQPVLRRAVLAELQGTAEAAAADGGRLLAVSTALAGGVPLANVLTVGVSDSGGRRAIDARRLARDFADEGDADVEVVDLPAGDAVRRVYRRRPRIEPGDAEVTSTVADYHVPIPDRPGCALRLTFSTPLPSPVAEAAMDLWDAVVTTLAWTPSDDSDGTEADVRQQA